MLILLAGALYYYHVLAKPVVASTLQLQATSFLLSRATSNGALTCVFNGSNYSFLSSSFDNITCDNIMHDAAAAMDILSNDRSVTDILWSCLATVFACTWVSVHPNIPDPRATDWQIRRHRGLLMLCGLIAPELIVLWALRQWLGARYIANIMNERRDYEFTMVHGHFLQMGGFMLSDLGCEEEIILDYDRLRRVNIPKVGEIRDKSKGDGLSKALVVGQTLWFVAQCISRWATGLAVTEAELVTLAFAALNGVIYFLWWDKPQDVRYAIQVTISPNAAPEESLSRNETASTQGPSGVMDDLQQMQMLFAKSFLGKLLRTPKTAAQTKLTVPMLHSCFPSEDSFAATGAASSIGILFGAIHCAAWNFEFPTPTERTLWRVSSVIITTMPIVLCIRSAVSFLFLKYTFRSWGRRITMMDEGWPREALIFVVRCINLPSIWLTALLVPIYVVARLSLLTQAILALRSLLPGEQAQVEWVNLLPHL